jgi:hypothetical protein
MTEGVFLDYTERSGAKLAKNIIGVTLITLVVSWLILGYFSSFKEEK